MPGRDNGFVARHYVPLADLDPRLADAMLEALRAEGIAAYVVPSTGQLGGYLEVHLPERPRDRLWVDRRHHDRATTLLNVHGDRPDLIVAATPNQLDDGLNNGPDGDGLPDGDSDGDVDGRPLGGDSTDDVWAQIVAGFDLPATVGAGPWPLAEDLPPDSDAAPSGDGSDRRRPSSIESLYTATQDPTDQSPVPRRIVRPVDPSIDAGASSSTASTPSGEYDPLSILDEHFVPGPPPPLPRLRRGTRWALAAILVGIVLIVGRAFWDSVPDAVFLGVLFVVGGFIGLVAMMREDRPSDSDPDDGAVV
ncbi:MAG TPA: hypothetical protein VN683_07460 [Acidothermaceae bacterium]|nr:hypothetical protein [Acidothermaceae bacterium]